MMRRSIELLYEIGSLRQLKRTWSQFLGTDTANITEHSFRVAWIALLLCAIEGKGDSGKVVKMALVHDLGESRTGDVHQVQTLYVQHDEAQAVKDILAGTPLEDEFYSLWEEYEERKSIESLLVKDADHLDCEFELGEATFRGSHVERALRTDRDAFVLPRLHTAAAEQMWIMRMGLDASDWYSRGRNKFHPSGSEN